MTTAEERRARELERKRRWWAKNRAVTPALDPAVEQPVAAPKERKAKAPDVTHQKCPNCGRQVDVSGGRDSETVRFHYLAACTDNSDFGDAGERAARRWGL